MKWFGQIGFFEHVQSEDEPAVYEEVITERSYYGDIIKRTKSVQENSVNTDFSVNNRISVLADPFAQNHFHSIAYVTFSGAKWRVSSAEVQYPRLILDIGELYNTEGELITDE